MAVRKTKSGKWEADVVIGYKLDGKPDRRRIKCATKTEALEQEKRLHIIRQDKRGKSYGCISFQDFVDFYYWPQKTKLRSSTVRGYKRDLNLRLLPAFGKMPLDEIGRFDIQKMISSCSTKKVATNARETLSSILRLAVEMEIIDKNPAGYSYEYPDEPIRKPDFYGVWLQNFDEIKRVVEWVCKTYPGTQIERITVLGLCFGLRKGEILGLDWDDVDFENRCIHIKQTYTEGEGKPQLTPPKTPNSTRTIPMIELAFRHMAGWTREAQSVVCTRTGRRLDPKAARCRAISAFRSGKTFDDGTLVPRMTIFSMRHSFGTACIAAGIDVKIVSTWMGHVDVTTTYNRYVKPKLETLQMNASEIDKLMGF